MLDPDEAEKSRPTPEPSNLDEMSIAALEAYLNQLREEIDRVRAKIAEKRKARVGAELVFKL